MNQYPAYNAQVANQLSWFNCFSSPGMFVGMTMEGLSPMCLPLVDLVKWINSFFTWSSLRPLVVSHLWAALNVVLTIFVAVVQFGADAVIDPSST